MLQRANLKTLGNQNNPHSEQYTGCNNISKNKIMRILIAIGKYVKFLNN